MARRGEETANPWIVRGIIAGVVGLCFVVVASFMVWVAFSHSPPPSDQVVQVELKSLQDQWRNNPVATYQKFKDFVVEFRGIVQSVDGGTSGAVEVRSPEDGGILATTTRVRLTGNQVNQMAAFPRGSTIVLRVRIVEAGEFLRPVAVAIDKPQP